MQPSQKGAKTFGMRRSSAIASRSGQDTFSVVAAVAMLVRYGERSPTLGALAPRIRWEICVVCGLAGTPIQAGPSLLRRRGSLPAELRAPKFCSLRSPWAQRASAFLRAEGASPSDLSGRPRRVVKLRPKPKSPASSSSFSP